MTKKRKRPSAEGPTEKYLPSLETDPPQQPQKEKWSKSKRKRMRRRLAKVVKNHDAEDSEPQDTSEKQPTTEASSIIGNRKPSSLQQAFMARLSGSRFRELNEELYTTTSEHSFEKFSSHPELYDQYHEGFRHQVEQWPVNPVNAIFKSLSSTYAHSKEPIVVADFGCGDAALAKKLMKIQINGSCPFQAHSFDLVASCDLVTACDMAHVPLPDQSVDVAIFCLSLMGTNLADFIREAHRVLKKPHGRLQIVEVRSRFESRKNENELEGFVQILDQLGFACLRKDQSNKMFVMLTLKPNGKQPDVNLEYTAKPCLYKRR